MSAKALRKICMISQMNYDRNSKRIIHDIRVASYFKKLIVNFVLGFMSLYECVGHIYTCTCGVVCMYYIDLHCATSASILVNWIIS